MESFVPGISVSNPISSVASSSQPERNMPQKKAGATPHSPESGIKKMVMESASVQNYSSHQEYKLGGRIDVCG
jgi:hypothetical protein